MKVKMTEIKRSPFQLAPIKVDPSFSSAKSNIQELFRRFDTGEIDRAELLRVVKV